MNQVLLIAAFILAMANLSMPAPAQAWLWLMRSQVTGANVITEPAEFYKNITFSRKVLLSAFFYEKNETENVFICHKSV